MKVLKKDISNRRHKKMQYSKKFESISPSPTLAIDSKFKEMKAAGLDAVGFGTGEPDFDTPDHIKAVAIDAINNGVTKYTAASGTPELKKAICGKLLRENGLDDAFIISQMDHTNIQTTEQFYIRNRDTMQMKAEKINSVFRKFPTAVTKASQQGPTPPKQRKAAYSLEL